MLYSWQHRKLTLNGRVLIIKSLIISQITYIVSCIPISEQIINTIEELLYTFLWCSKTNKVRKSVMIQEFSHCGHKMIDLKSFIKAQKLKWIKQYLTNHHCLWRNIMEKLINVSNLNLFLRSNFTLCRNTVMSNFYNEVILNLEELITANQSNQSENVMNQYVFYNKLLTVDNRMLYDDELFKAGMWKVSDIFDSSGFAIGFNVWKSRGVCKSKYMLWRSVISKVRSLGISFVRDTLCNEHSSVVYLTHDDKIDLESSSSKDIYRKIVKLKLETPTSLNKYANLIDTFTTTERKNMFLLPRICTKNTKLKEFQFKILHRYLPTNVLLFKMKKTESQKCTFCYLYNESITHLLYECIHVKNLWFKIQEMLQRVTNKNILLTCTDAIFGYKLDNIRNEIALNNFLLHTKYFIWKSRVKYRCPSYHDLKIYINHRKNIETCLEEFYEYL